MGSEVSIERGEWIEQTGPTRPGTASLLELEIGVDIHVPCDVDGLFDLIEKQQSPCTPTHITCQSLQRFALHLRGCVVGLEGLRTFGVGLEGAE